jgi:hypothetical protein
MVFLSTELYGIHHKKAISCRATAGRSQPQIAFVYLYKLEAVPIIDLLQISLVLNIRVKPQYVEM